MLFDYGSSEALLVLDRDAPLDKEAMIRADELKADTSTPSEKDLENWQVSDDQLSYEAAVKMDLNVAKIDASFSRRVVVRDISRYTERKEGENLVVWGVAVRLTVTVWSAKLEGRLTLPVVAAQAQLGIVNASANLRILGFNNNAVGKILPKFENLDVGSYGEYSTASDKVRDFISKHPENIVPVKLKTIEKLPAQNERLTTSIGSARALRFLSRRRSLNDALDGTDAWPALADAVSATYAEFVPGGDSSAKPSAAASEEARNWEAWID